VCASATASVPLLQCPAHCVSASANAQNIAPVRQCACVSASASASAGSIAAIRCTSTCVGADGIAALVPEQFQCIRKDAPVRLIPIAWETRARAAVARVELSAPARPLSSRGLSYRRLPSPGGFARDCEPELPSPWPSRRCQGRVADPVRPQPGASASRCARRPQLQCQSQYDSA
jgi:hypothetical protein